MQPQVQGSTMLKVCGVLMIIGAALGLLVYVLALAGAAILGGAAAAIAFIFMFMGIAGAILQLIAGIQGVKNWQNPQKAGVCIVMGAIVAGLSAISNIYTMAQSGEVGSGLFGLLLGLVIPVLYIVGAYQLKQQGQA